MSRRTEDACARALLDQLTQIHHRDLISEVLDCRQVMRDEQAREPKVPLQVREQIQYGGLDGHVECTRGLVRHQQPWFGDERPGDADPLALTTRQLVRCALCDLGAQPYTSECFRNLTCDVFATHQPQWFADDVSDGQAWVERPCRVLEDDRDVSPV